MNTETEKKYKCFISSKEVWWTISSIDKPFWRYFESEYENTFVEIDHTPNWIDNFTIQMVVENQNISMVKLEQDKDLPYYFLFNRVVKKLSKGYIIEFDLDIWVTFGQETIKRLQGRTGMLAQAKVNRLSPPLLKSVYGSTTKPELINAWKIKQDPVINFKGHTKVIYREPFYYDFKNTEFVAKMDYQLDFQLSKGKLLSSTNIGLLNAVEANEEFKVVCSVYQKPNGDYLCFPNIMGNIYLNQSSYKCLSESNYNYLINDGAGGESFWFGRAIWTGAVLEFNFQALGLGKYYQQYVNLHYFIPYLNDKFIGIFEIPFLSYITNWKIWNGSYLDPTDSKKVLRINKSHSNPNISNPYYAQYLFFEIPCSGYIKLRDYSSATSFLYNAERFIANKKINFNTNTNPEYYNFNYDNKEALEASRISGTGGRYEVLSQFVSIYDWPFKTQLNNLFSNKLLTFDGNRFNVFDAFIGGASTDKNVINIPSQINSFNGTMNVATDSFQSYVNQTKVMQNTNLEIAKQEKDLGIAKSVVGGVTGFISGGIQAGVGVAMGNPFATSQGISQAIESIPKMGFGINDAIRKYENYQKTIDAQNITARQTSTATNIKSSVETDDIYNKLSVLNDNIYKDEKLSVLIPIRFPLKFTDQMHYMTYLYYYGVYVDEFVGLNNLLYPLTNYNDFGIFHDNGCAYFDLDIPMNFIDNVFGEYPISIRTTIKTIFDNSIRIWKNKIQYSYAYWYIGLN